VRVAILGGTRFIGLATATELLGAGEDVLLIHRVEHEPPELGRAKHLHADRRELVSVIGEITDFQPDVVIDTCAMTRADAEVAGAIWPATARLVVLSSCDVYRAYTSRDAGDVTDAVPLDESAPVRAERYPYRGRYPGLDDYEKLDVEEAYRARGATILRLGFVYGPNDPQRREEFVLRRVRAGRPRIPFGVGTWLLSRCFVRDAAMAICLAARSERVPGEVFNVAEARSPTVRLWAEQIIRAADSRARLVRVPDSRLPEDLRISAAIAQPLLFDSAKARALLGWGETQPETAVAESVRWHLAHPPAGSSSSTDFSQDDAALAES
jgi:UDP-glucose 4-epimerase